MSLATTLQALLRAVLDEAARNPEFAARLEQAIGLAPKPPKPPKAVAARKARRAQPVLNPIALAPQGEAALRAALAPLSVEQLKDIIAAHGMDSDKLAMKWKTAAKLVDRIIATSLARQQKGEAFLR
jgi:hypothetical protein